MEPLTDTVPQPQPDTLASMQPPASANPEPAARDAAGPDQETGPSPQRRRSPGVAVGAAARFLGAALLLIAVVGHEALIRGFLDIRVITWLAGGLGGYALISWIALRLLHDPEAAAPTRVLTVLDLAAMAGAVYVAGADESWLFWIFLLRVIDRTAPTVEHSLVTAGLGVVAYLGVVVWAAVADGPVAWPAQAVKLGFLALGGGYVAVVVGGWKRERARIRAEADEAGRARALEAEQRERALERARDEARAESLARSRFLARVANELRGPVSGLIALARALEREPMTDGQRRSVRTITQRGLHLRRIIDEVLDIARVEMGSLELGPVALEPALREVLDRARQAAERRDVRLPVDPPVEADIWVMANDRKLKQVFANLLSNAIRYNSSPGEVRLSCDHGPGTIRVSVTDTGPGIPADRIQSLFRPFDRPVAEAGMGGTGLGLPVARSLVEGMGGRLGVESYPDAGSTFWFELESTEPPTEPEEAPEPERRTVVYIGSQQENRTLIDRILSRRPGVDLMASPTGMEGLDTVRAREPDLILLELTLPDMAGREALWRLQLEAETRAIPVLMVTSEAAPAEAERLRERGARACFTLPYDVVGFRDTIDALLRLRRNDRDTGGPD